MAVQAQYPSNVLLLNRAAQEGKNPLSLSNHEFHQLQAHTGGSGGEGAGAGGGGGFSFFDQSIMSSFNHGVGGTITSNTSRKRGREMQLAGCGGGGGASMMNMNRPLISVAPQMDLTQQQRNSVSIGLGLTFGEHQHHQQPPPVAAQHSISLSPQSSAQSSVLLSILSDDLASHIKQQRDEIEHFILAQGEQLRRTLAEKRQRHYRSLLSAAEESVARRLREKDAEVEKASRRNAELQAKAAQLSMEAQAWQHRAKMQENMAANLHAQLERAIITSGGGGALQEKEEYSGAGVVGGGDAEDAESAYIDPDRVVERPGPPCKACRIRTAAVVVLPCRHVSLCRECDAVAQNCPLCLGVRTSSLEVFLT